MTCENTKTSFPADFKHTKDMPRMGAPLSCASERDIFAALSLEYLEPSNRNRWPEKWDLLLNKGATIPNDAPKCAGHQRLCMKLQVKKDGANKGKFFYKCAQTRNDQCSFFKWADKWEEEQKKADGVGGGAPATNRTY
jgi:hypothetical protein